ncbi:MAG: DUF1841 family protein [Acidobacteria bacterium]|nr:MAG: DUF1841 family protein [Acidobacteriota bacterium]
MGEGGRSGGRRPRGGGRPRTGSSGDGRHVARRGGARAGAPGVASRPTGPEGGGALSAAGGRAARRPGARGGRRRRERRAGAGAGDPHPRRPAPRFRRRPRARGARPPGEDAGPVPVGLLAALRAGPAEARPLGNAVGLSAGARRGAGAVSGDPLDPRALRSVARAGREALRRLWSRRDDREALRPGERRLLELLEAHPEYRPFWEGAEPDEGENPFLHITLHDMIEQQVDTGEPPEAAEALARLTAAGVDRHEAVHTLLRVFVRELSAMLETKGAFDRDRYRARLDRLGRKEGGDGTA